MFADFENLNLPRIIAIILFFIGGGILERKSIVKQDEILVLLNKQDISRSFNKIIEVNEGIISNLENISKEANEGDILFLKGKSSAFDVTLQDSNTVELEGDFTFNTSMDRIQLVRISNKWKEVTRSNYP